MVLGVERLSAFALRLVVLLAIGFIVFLGASAAHAAEITVSTRLDEFGTNEEKCSLREAVQAANTNSNFGGCTRARSGVGDKILLSGGKTYERSLAGIDDSNAAGDLDIVGPTTIEVRGDGRATIDANDLDRVFDVSGGLKASRVIVQNGTASSSPGGGIRVSTTGNLVLRSSLVRLNEASFGGGVESEGVAELDRVDVVDNVAGVGGGVAHGSGQLTVQRSTIDGNEATISGGGVHLSAGEASISSSTISGNEALGDDEGTNGGGGINASEGGGSGDWRLVNVTVSSNASYAQGGGIWVQDGSLTLNAVTVTANIGDSGGITALFSAAGGIHNLDGLVRFKNSIVAGNMTDYPDQADCQGELVDVGTNLVGQLTGCPATSGTSLVRADPKLQPLADNGGPTETHALKATSAAVGRAGQSSPDRDQRGVKRDSKPDIGAFERKP